MSDNKDENRKTIADIVAIVRQAAQYYDDEAEKSEGLIRKSFELSAASYRTIADLIESAIKREHDLIRSCARWILTYDIYGHMSKELLEDCKNVLEDDGQFLNK